MIYSIDSSHVVNSFQVVDLDFEPLSFCFLDNLDMLVTNNTVNSAVPRLADMIKFENEKVFLKLKNLFAVYPVENGQLFEKHQ